jgi:undecaprenyl-diphosphatase
LTYGLIASLASVLLARILADSLPVRQRPIYHPLLHTQIAQGFRTETLLGWSSFPSDHATLFATLACVLMYISRPIGILAFLYVLAVIDLPRIILGIHFPTDILAGTGLGVGIAALAKCTRVRDWVTGPALRFRDRQPGLFYAAFSLLIFGTGTVFWPVFEIMHFGRALVRGVLHRAIGLM